MIISQATLLLAILATASASASFDASLAAAFTLISDDGSITTADQDDTTATITGFSDHDTFSSASSEASYQVTAPRSMQPDLVSGADMGEPQLLGGEAATDVIAIIEAARAYLQDTVAADPKLAKIKSICLNKHAQCGFWASVGECEANPGFMNVNCAPVCQSCDQLSVEARCPMDNLGPDAFQNPGDLNAMFERIVNEPSLQKYEPVVLSRPSYKHGDTAGNATYSIGLWMVMFENALSEDEAHQMIELGGLLGYERSSDVGDELPDGTFTQSVNSGRTSTNAWCVGECYENATAQTLMARIEEITGIPETNSENLQLLRYEEDEFYQTHNDYIPYNIDRPSGVRVLTFYMYLNDVAEGGGTNFPRASNLTVTPKRGRAVLWPSVYDHDPNRKDPRSDHQAQKVVKGVKYGANAWIHQRDFKSWNDKGC
ncbi:hypothetical protein MPSEU_000012700 [Mayamaea pseudoterrestris]|nr:hypothetical protein MPSEU_000012700 [Mayamaea pseudoterrestris]